MAEIVLVRHDPGCYWARPGAEADIDSRGRITGIKKAGAGHSDAARRFAEMFNLHKAAGAAAGWIAIAYADGRGGFTVYDTRADAVSDCWPYEDRFFYCRLAEHSMTVCAAETLLRYRRIMSELDRPDRDQPHGGLEVIPRLAIEDQEAQIRAVRAGRGHVAMGHRREHR